MPCIFGRISHPSPIFFLIDELFIFITKPHQRRIFNIGLQYEEIRLSHPTYPRNQSDHSQGGVQLKQDGILALVFS